MKTVVIVGGSREAACGKLRKIAGNDGIRHLEFYDEAALDGHRVVAIGGGADDVCWLRALGFGVEIIVVERMGTSIKVVKVGEANISEEMRWRINHVQSSNRRGNNG